MTVVKLDERKERLWFYAIADKLLVGGRVRYLLFFDGDERYRGPPSRAARFTRVFPTRNGFHAIGNVLDDEFGKYLWFQDWFAKYPGTDYKMNNLNWLAPASDEELNFIMEMCPVAPIASKYYRDKAVFETLDQAGIY